MKKNEVFKVTSKLVLKFLIILLVLISILIIVNLIPRKYIEKNVRESIPIFINEGNYPKIKFAYNYLLDNYTDALMLNTAYSVDSDNPVESTMLMRRNYRAKENLELQDIDGYDKPIEYLVENVNGTNKTYFQYSRYWHGYMIYLRPLLVFLNYSQIRMVFLTIIIYISIMLIYVSYKKINGYIALATTLMLITSNFWAIGLSLHYSAVYIIAIITSIYILLKNEKIKDIKSVFFITGMLTSFFDLFTTPLLTLGIPLVFYLMINNRENLNIKYMLKLIVIWGIGYSLMWLSKWIISDIICNTGTIINSLQKVLFYTNGANEIVISVLQVIKINLQYILQVLVLLIFGTILSCVISYKKHDLKSKKMLYPLLVIGVLPFIWFSIIKNHSYIHARFTFRNLMLTNFVLLVLIINNIKVFIKSSRNKSI